MSYQVSLEVFSGPFDLLLNLISRHKVSIYDVPLATITEEYLRYLEEMRQLDLEIASEFLLVAATLLEVKSAGLLPQPPRVEEEEAITAFEQRQMLISRLIEYRKFKNAGMALGTRLKTEKHFFLRRAALDPEFENLLPDFLADIDIQDLALMIQKLLDRERVRLIDSSHIATIKISVDDKLEEVVARLARAKKLFFGELVDGVDRSNIVATFLALLELYKRGLIEVEQAQAFGEIKITRSKAGGKLN